MGSNQYQKVYDLCVYFMTGTPQGSTESGFMEKPGMEPATPGLQDIGLSPTPRRPHDQTKAICIEIEFKYSGTVTFCGFLLVFVGNQSFFLWCSQNAEKDKHMKVRLLDQAVIFINCVPVQNGNFS